MQRTKCRRITVYLFYRCILYLQVYLFFWQPALRKTTLEWILGYKTNLFGSSRECRELRVCQAVIIQQFIETLEVDCSYMAVHTKPGIALFKSQHIGGDNSWIYMCTCMSDSVFTACVCVVSQHVSNRPAQYRFVKNLTVSRPDS